MTTKFYSSLTFMLAAALFHGCLLSEIQAEGKIPFLVHNILAKEGKECNLGMPLKASPTYPVSFQLTFHQQMQASRP